ncbi:helix-turn-helix transcriptional regulator [Azospirillum sp. ST 5-10]|uniref:helix-turn-helix transcriptional regulator n=1 Tax=unclassified Azospirillum TaxID=2630922 RepID=UPI003F49C3CB
MKRPVLLTSDEADAIEHLGRRVRLARLRRNLSQEEMADRIGVTRKTYIAFERGKETVNVGVLVKVLSVFGYTGRLADLLASDPLGEDLEEIHGRKRASSLEG